LFDFEVCPLICEQITDSRLFPMVEQLYTLFSIAVGIPANKKVV
jgi:hypothetical protein